MNKFLIVGLGNIGEEYKHTRHNIGFDVIDFFVHKHGGLFITDRLAERAEIRIKGRTLICIKPATYMNLSGKAVKYWIDKEKVDINRVLVIVDELALPLSKLRIKASGSDGGHNGLRSIQESLGTNIYPRLRFGIGNLYPRGRQVEYVLGRWDTNEELLVQKKIEKCAEVIENWALAGIEATMNTTNNLEFMS